jgi:hypothetical protein
MPVIPSSYRPPLGFGPGHGHRQTWASALLRQLPPWTTRRERIATPDHDFLDLDWSPPTSERRLVVITHGLEGNSRVGYVQGMARAFVKRGWQVLAWNCRSCSGEPNQRLHFYHSGASGDLRTVVRHVLDQNRFSEIALVGFSLGGNITLKFLGEEGETVDPRIAAGVAISVPCDLGAASTRLDSLENQMYRRAFLRSLKAKFEAKAKRYPGHPELDVSDWKGLRSFREFEDRYMAPLHGFDSAEDYWARSSCRGFLDRIRIPALILNALDDPFLADGCYPIQEAVTHPHVYLEMPEAGGHAGFVTFGRRGEYWSETRAAEWVECGG